MEYSIILATDAKGLVEHVSDSISRGWKPLGGAFIDSKGFCQTMTKTGKGTPKKRFVPPILDEVKEYIKEQKFGVNADTWLSFYQSKNWMVGRVKMKDWKACIRTWQYKTQNSKEPLNIPQPKPFNAPKIGKKVSQGRIQELKNMSKIDIYKATGQLPEEN